MTKPTAVLLVCLLFASLTEFDSTSQAQSAALSVRITAHLTADNHYALYHGHADASDLTLVGRNEIGYTGSNGGAPWNHPETWVFDADEDEYLYVVAWDDADSSTMVSMWIGDFSARRNRTLVSNHDEWECIRIRDGLPGAFGEPNVVDVMNAIAAGSWSQPQADAFNLPGFLWGGIPVVSPDARLLWIDPFWTQIPYVVFRAPVSALSRR